MRLQGSLLQRPRMGLLIGTGMLIRMRIATVIMGCVFIFKRVFSQGAQECLNECFWLKKEWLQERMGAFGSGVACRNGHNGKDWEVCEILENEGPEGTVAAILCMEGGGLWLFGHV